MAELREQGRVCADQGVVAAALPVASPGSLSAVIDDAPIFEAQVEANRTAGHHRVPYVLTPAIEAVAEDASITAVVNEVLGHGQRWVMWGPNIQTGTPNQAGRWHVDLESFLWPSLTVAIGLTGCRPENATRCIPWSQHLGLAPASRVDPADDRAALRFTASRDARCSHFVVPSGFGDGMFYAFDARCWHSGQEASSAQRTLLFLHYHRASDPRIPLMLDYEKKRWSRRPAPYFVGPEVPEGNNSEGNNEVNRRVQRPPSRVRRRIARLTGRPARRSGPVAR